MPPWGTFSILVFIVAVVAAAAACGVLVVVSVARGERGETDESGGDRWDSLVVVRLLQMRFDEAGGIILDTTINIIENQ